LPEHPSNPSKQNITFASDFFGRQNIESLCYVRPSWMNFNHDRYIIRKNEVAKNSDNTLKRLLKRLLWAFASCKTINWIGPPIPICGLEVFLASKLLALYAEDDLIDAKVNDVTPNRSILSILHNCPRLNFASMLSTYLIYSRISRVVGTFFN